MPPLGKEAQPEIEAAGRSVRHPLTRALLFLTLTTGLIDAVSFLGLGQVFTANMTGNIVFLGFGIAGAGGLPVISPLVSLAAFLAGATAGGILGSRAEASPRGHLSRPLLLEASLLGLAAIVTVAIDVEPNRASGDAVIALIALAMGIRNATVRRLAVPDLTTTVLTMTLTGLAADSPLTGHSGAGSTRRTAAVAAMLAGAVAGALMLKTSLFLPIAAASVLAAATWFSYVPRRQVP